MALGEDALKRTVDAVRNGERLMYESDWLPGNNLPTATFTKKTLTLHLSFVRGERIARNQWQLEEHRLSPDVDGLLSNDEVHKVDLRHHGLPFNRRLLCKTSRQLRMTRRQRFAAFHGGRRPGQKTALRAVREALIHCNVAHLVDKNDCAKLAF